MLPLSLAPDDSRRPRLALPAGQALLCGRVHEMCGPARVALAAMAMGAAAGPVIWALAAWTAERIYPDGLVALADPGRLVLVRARRPEDLLWTMEEALRAGAAPLVVAELAEPPRLTPVRRLHLAAEAGAEAAARLNLPPPTGLLLTPGEGGAQGVESRWFLDHAPSGSTLVEDRRAWRMERRRARLAPPAAWALRQTGRGRIEAEGLPPAA
jgi:protein ImuA